MSTYSSVSSSSSPSDPLLQSTLIDRKQLVATLASKNSQHHYIPLFFPFLCFINSTIPYNIDMNNTNGHTKATTIPTVNIHADNIHHSNTSSSLAEPFKYPDICVIVPITIVLVKNMIASGSIRLPESSKYCSII
jgi:hypothetical protein